MILPTVSASEVVVASAGDAFEFIADYRNIPRLQPHFVTATLVGEVERQVGAQVDLDGRFHGIPMRARNRIIAYDPPTRLVSVSEGTVLSRSTWDLQQVSDDPPTTQVTLTVDYKFRSSLGGLFMGSSFGSLFNREVQGMTDESLHRLGRFFDEKTGS
jgi:ribosome-associated toxin RatA of RatAB toxin-antitoxin module